MHGKFRKSIKSISSIDKNDGACKRLVTFFILLVIGLCSACSRHMQTRDFHEADRLERTTSDDLVVRMHRPLFSLDGLYL